MAYADKKEKPSVCLGCNSLPTCQKTGISRLATVRTVSGSKLLTCNSAAPVIPPVRHPLSRNKARFEYGDAGVQY